MPLYYILDGKEPVPCTDPIEWIQWCEERDRTVCKDQIGPILVSTVFVGMNQGSVDGLPVLFETMCFHEDGGWSGFQCRYHTWAEAEEGHKEICSKVRYSMELKSAHPPILAIDQSAEDA